MSVERKKAVLKPIKKLEPKKREVTPKEVIEETPKKEVIKKVVKETPKKETEIVVEEPKEVKQRAKPSENKYIRIGVEATSDERKQISDKVKSGEIKWSYFATDGDKGYHYYIVFKK